MGDTRKVKRSLRAALMLVMLGLVLAAAGCGSDDNDKAKEAAAAPAATATQAAPADGPVKVVLDQWSVKPAVTSAKAGEVTFEVQNAGSIEHEMVVIRTNKAADDLGKGARVPETGTVGEQAEFAGGLTKTLKLKLKPGHYALVCNISGHYPAGMYADFDVS